MNTITKKEAALTYIRRKGWPLFPVYEPDGRGGCACGNAQCASPAKHPRVKHGVLEATTNEARILDWWNRWPESNIGIATGLVSKIIVLDIDPARGGEVSLADLEAKRGRFAPTLECATGGGGRHLYFLHPGDKPMKNRVDLLPGIDIRGDGGYVVAPPSVHISGGLYKWMPTK